MTIDEKGQASLWLDDYLAELRKYPHRYADDIEGLERVGALLQSQAAEIKRLTRERDGLSTGLSALVHCQSPLTRSQMREAAADLLDKNGLKPTYLSGDQSPFVIRAEAAQSALSEALERFAQIDCAGYSRDRQSEGDVLEYVKALASAFLSKYGREGK